ncbi:MAG TPA: transposase [Chitinophagales bacterium]|nr:transposase [Chitinophagales bacterium]
MIQLLPNKYYHVYNHANGNENLFREDENYLFFVKQYGYYINAVADTFAYSLMPNHFHLLIQIKSETELFEIFKGSAGFKEKDFNPSDIISHCFSNLFNSYSKSYNKVFNRRGSLFNHKFKRKEVEDNDYLIKLIHYIHANPVHHGFVKRIEDWKYISYHGILSQGKTHLQRSQVLEWFGGRDEFIRVHQQQIDLKMTGEFFD